MQSRKTPLRSLTIFLIKDGIESVEQILKVPDGLERHPVQVAGSDIGDLFVRPSKTTTPRWVNFFDPASIGSALAVENSSSSAVFLVKQQGRTFALTFGYGWQLLLPGCYEERFGLKVTLNSIEADKLQTIDVKSLEAASRQTIIQVSRPSSVGTFGFDVETDLLRAATGVPTDKSLGNVLTGRDRLHAIAPVELQALPALLGRYLEKSREDTYKEHFAWVDHIGELRDSAVQTQLEAMVDKKLQEQDFQGMWLAVPEIIEWRSIGGFRYGSRKTATLNPDISLRDYLDAANAPDRVSTDRLRHGIRIQALHNESDQVQHDWTVFACLNCELELDGNIYLLSEGKWYRVNREFAAQVDAFVAGIHGPTEPLGPYRDLGEREYNARIAAESEGTLALVDRKTVTLPGIPDPIEPADLYEGTGRLIHVKRYAGSSVLSHLFAQARVSGELFHSSPEFRRAFNDRLPGTHKLAKPEDNIGNREYEIALGIVSKSEKPLHIPFFSRVNLRATVKALRPLGFRITLQAIRNETDMQPEDNDEDN